MWGGLLIARIELRLDVFVNGEGSSGKLGHGNSKTAIDVKHPLNHNRSARKVGVVQIAIGGMPNANSSKALSL